MPGLPKQTVGCTRSAGADGGTSMGAHEDYIYKNLMTLVRDVYPTLRAGGVLPPLEAEFAGHAILLLSMRGYQSAIQDVYYDLPAACRRAPAVRLALEFNDAIYNNNYVRFFAMVRRAETPYPVCALAHQHFPRMRRNALLAMA